MQGYVASVVLYLINTCVLTNGAAAGYLAFSSYSGRRLVKRQVPRNGLGYRDPYNFNQMPIQHVNGPYLGNADIQIIEVDQFGNPVVPYQRGNYVPANTNMPSRNTNRNNNQYEIKVIDVDEEGNVFQENSGPGGMRYIGNIYNRNQNTRPGNVHTNGYPNSNVRPQTPQTTNMGNQLGNQYPQTQNTNNQGNGVGLNNPQGQLPFLDGLSNGGNTNHLIHVPPKNQNHEHIDPPINSNKNQPEHINPPSNSNKNHPDHIDPPINSNKNPPIEHNGNHQTESTPVRHETEAPYIFDNPQGQNKVTPNAIPKVPTHPDSQEVARNREDVLQHTPTFQNKNKVDGSISERSIVMDLNDGEIRK